VLGSKTRKRNREIKPHTNFSLPMISKAIQLLVCFVTSFAGQNLKVFKRWRLNWREAI
jgi:hypothetical protein